MALACKQWDTDNEQAVPHQARPALVLYFPQPALCAEDDRGLGQNRQISPKFAPARVFNRQLVGLEYRQVKLAYLAGM